MKIIYILNSRMPTERAYGIQVAKMCEALAKLGAEVVLLFPKRDNSLKGQDCFSYYGVEKNFEVKQIFSVDLLKYGFLNIFSFWLGTLSFYCGAFLYILFKMPNFKIVYTRDFYAASILKILRKKIVLEIHNLPKRINLFYKFFLRANDKIIAITNGLKEGLIESGVDSNKILLLPDGVDLDKFNIKVSKEAARDKLGLPQNKNLVLYVGNLYKWKGVYTLALASQFLSAKETIIFVGGGVDEDLPKLKNFITKNNLQNIQTSGHRPYSEVPYYLKSADVLVLPNSASDKVSELFTSPLKLFEYMASGKPIVASNLPSLREVLNDKNAFFFEPDNPKDLADAIKKILENRNLSNMISKQAFEDVKNYTWQKRAEKILNFIKSADEYAK